MDTKNSKRSERRTAIAGHEIVFLSETRFAETGCLTDAGYIFYWSAKGKDKPHEGGLY
jgi:hypothetical protein